MTSSTRNTSIRVCVFCGSRSGERAVYADTALALGTLLAQRGFGLVYGGGNIGLMGLIADATLAAGGEVIGVIPQHLLEREVAHTGLTQLHVVDSMHTRKALMADIADVFVAAPGGFGTLDELCEILTWAQLGLHGKPCGLLNVAGYFDPLLGMFDHATREGFLSAQHRQLIVSENDAQHLIDRLVAAIQPGKDVLHEA
ncbi:MAG TPA: TIGR00730 family Rossman fold protein [Methyloversatilis sp.]